MYTLTNIGFKDFKCYRGTHELDLSNKPVIDVVARYIDVVERSNWAGKSTIGAIIKYLLYGRTDSSLLEKVVSWGSDQASVWGTLTDMASGNEVSIIRSVTSKGSSSLVVNGEEGVEKSTAILNNILGLSYEDWLLSAFFQQDDVKRFTGLRPSEKREEVQRWIERSCWPTLCKLAKDRLRVIIDAIDECRRTINQTAEDLKDLEYQESKKVKELDEEKKIYSSYQAAIDSRHQVVINLQNNNRIFSDYMNTWLETVKKNNYVVHDYMFWLKQKELDDLEKEAAKAEESWSIAQQLYLDKKKRYNDLKVNATGEFSGKCPIDGKACPRADELREGSSCNALLPAALAEMRSAESSFRDSGDIKQGFSSKLQVLRREIAALQIKAECPEDCLGFPDSNMWLDTRDEILKCHELLDSSESDSNNAESSSSKIRFIERELGVLSQRITVAKRVKKEIDDAKAKLKDLEQKSLALTFLVYAFSKEGISAAQVEASLDQIVVMADYHLAQLGTGLNLRFSYEKELKKKSDICYDCGTTFPPRVRNCPTCNKPRPFKRASDLGIDVCVDGQWEELDLQSGGCQALVAVMLRFAVSKMLRQCGKLTAPVGWIDEILGSLDVVNRVALAKEIISGGDLGLQQRIVVTHNEEIQAMFPHTLLVEKDGKWSTVSWI